MPKVFAGGCLALLTSSLQLFRTLGGIRRVSVYVPPGYDKNPNAKYPVLYLLHGANLDETAWIRFGKANLILDNLLAAGKAKPYIVVMPFGYGVPPMQRLELGKNTEAFGRDLREDLIPYIEGQFRALTGVWCPGCGLTRGVHALLNGHPLQAMGYNVFTPIVVVLIVVALTLVILQPRLSKRLAVAREARAPRDASREVPPVLAFLVCLAGVYGGYFGAAQGIILIAVLGLFLDDHLQPLNACKNATRFATSVGVRPRFPIWPRIPVGLASVAGSATSGRGQSGVPCSRA